MGIKDTLLGWLSSTPDKEDELEDAEADELTREYSADRADTVAGFELGGGRGPGGDDTREGGGADGRHGGERAHHDPDANATI